LEHVLDSWSRPCEVTSEANNSQEKGDKSPILHVRSEKLNEYAWYLSVMPHTVASVPMLRKMLEKCLAEKVAHSRGVRDTVRAAHEQMEKFVASTAMDVDRMLRREEGEDARHGVKQAVKVYHAALTALASELSTLEQSKRITKMRESAQKSAEYTTKLNALHMDAVAAHSALVAAKVAAGRQMAKVDPTTPLELQGILEQTVFKLEHGKYLLSITKTSVAEVNTWTGFL
jgi:hypothetical protein